MDLSFGRTREVNQEWLQKSKLALRKNADHNEEV